MGRVQLFIKEATIGRLGYSAVPGAGKVWAQQGLRTQSECKHGNVEHSNNISQMFGMQTRQRRRPKHNAQARQRKYGDDAGQSRFQKFGIHVRRKRRPRQTFNMQTRQSRRPKCRLLQPSTAISSIARVQTDMSKQVWRGCMEKGDAQT